MVDLGKLVKVPINEVWPREPSDFTPWLAKHIDLLGDELGLDIDPDTLKGVDIGSRFGTEIKVGSFSADIVAQDSSGNKIVIENQYGNTDHDHLGKMITYAAGINAKTVIWVSESVREEHQKAIEFLNNSTTDDLNLFLVQIEAWRIGDSKSAPRFNIVEAPNEWAKVIKTSSSDSGRGSELSLIKFNFWRRLREIGVEKYPNIRWRNPSRDHWYAISVGSRISHVSLQINSKGRPKVSVSYEFWPKSKDKTAYDYIFERKNEIENELGKKLIWDRKNNNQHSKISFEREGDYRKEDQRDELANWLIEMAVEFLRVFPKYDENVKGGI